MHIAIGLDKQDGDGLAITVKDEIKKNIYAYHFFDIDKKAIIVRHVEKPEGRNEVVHFDLR